MNRAMDKKLSMLIAHDAETRTAAQADAWDEGRNSFGADFLKPLDTFGVRPQTVNPYRAAKEDKP